MKPVEFQILPVELLDAYKEIILIELLSSYEQLQESELTLDTFSFYTSVSAVFSSKIEGEPIELDSYIKHKRFGIEFLPDYTRKIDDLYNAYQFAKTTVCNKVNVTKTHQMLTQNILPAGRQGKIRAGNMYVTTPDGRIEYVAAAPGTVYKELEKFYADVEILQAADLSLHEVFFFAALMHLVFVKIHPFDDGNGRTARLIEKWFLANKLGEKVWLIQSEKNYYQQHQTYYKNLRLLGLEYELLDYNKALPFLMMLPKALK
jgi:Fic family protein